MVRDERERERRNTHFKSGPGGGYWNLEVERVERVEGGVKGKARSVRKRE